MYLKARIIPWKIGLFRFFLQLYYSQAVTEEEYPDDVYPTNCFGTFYVISRNIRDRLYKVRRIR